MDSDLRAYIAGLDSTVPTVGGQQTYINLDNAASTPPFNSVLQIINDFAPWYSSVHRGNGFKSRLSTEAYEAARQITGQFFGANPDEHVVIFGKNTTEAINKLSFRLNLKKVDIVLVSALEHHSNDLPWRARATVKRIGLTPQGGIDRKNFNSLLKRYAGQIRLVAISGASNVTGYMPDIRWFARKAHDAGAQILVDCAQLAPHRQIDIKPLDDPEHLDYIAISGHKMYAPFGTGALIGRRDTFMRGKPEYAGGGTINLVTSKTVDWALPPDSDEAGSPNVVGAVALARALQTLGKIGMDKIAQHESALAAYTTKRLKEIPGLRIYGRNGAHSDRLGVIPFTLKKIPANLVAAILGYEWGIGVRSGCFCAHIYVMNLLGLDGKGEQHVRHAMLHKRRDLMPGMVRVSLGLYNTRQEIDQLAKALLAISHGEYGEYILSKTTGHYTPVQDAKNPILFFNI